MKKRHSIQVAQEMEQYYQQIKNLLLQESTYEQEVNLTMIKSFMRFLDTGLETIRERIQFLGLLIFDLNDKDYTPMNPFALLKDKEGYEIDGYVDKINTLSQHLS